MISLENYGLSDYESGVYSDLLEAYPQLNNMTIDQMKVFADSLDVEACGLRSEAEDIDNWMHILENFIGMIQEREDCND